MAKTTINYLRTNRLRGISAAPSAPEGALVSTAGAVAVEAEDMREPDPEASGLTGEYSAGDVQIHLDDNPDPLRRRITNGYRRSRMVRFITWLWSWRPWRPPTEEERLERIEQNRRNELQAVLRAEAIDAETRIVNCLNRRELCYRYKKSERDWFISGVKSVRFKRVGLQPEALWFQVDTERLPRGVGITQLMDPDVLTDLSISVGHRVYGEYSPDNGVWYIVERAAGVRAIPAMVRYNDIMDHFPRTGDRYTFPVGLGVNNRRLWVSLLDMPHGLIAGSTKSGKSNFLNCVLGTLISRNTPADLRLLLVDLKGGLELSFYEGIPHLLDVPGIAPGGLIYEREAVPDVITYLMGEMDRRTGILRAAGHKNLKNYNARRERKLPVILLVIDEYADVKLFSKLGRAVDEKMANLAAKSRAVGIHILVGTQYPKREVIDTLITANLPAKFAFSTTGSGSMVILGNGAAAQLAPAGRSVYQLGAQEILVQTPYMPDTLIREIVQAVKTDRPADYSLDVSIQDILAWAIENNGGKLTARTLFEKFNTVPNATITRWLNELPETIDLDGRVYRVMPGGPKNPRRLEIIDLPVGEPGLIE
jgi:hypothetical protein